MGSLDELSYSSKFLYVQVDTVGKIIDCNDLFSTTYGDLMLDSVCKILQVDDIKDVVSLTNSLKEKRNNPVIIRINTNLKGKIHLSMWKILYVKGCFIALGNKFEEELIFALNHNIRSNSATIEGLLQFRKELDNDQLLDLIDQKAKDLNKEIAKIMDFVTGK